MTNLCISVIIPTRNQGSFIARTLESVLGQTGSFELELLVLDGGSEDQTVEILQRYGDRFYWESKRDHGQIDAINRGLRMCRGDIVGWLNSDDLLLPGALDAIAKTFSLQQHCMWLHGDCRIINESDQEIRRWVSVYKRWHARRYSFNRLLHQNFISQMTVYWRRSLLQEIGFLDERYPLAFDYEYWLRLAKRWPPYYIGEQVAAFRWYSSSKSGANFARQFAETEQITQLYGVHQGNRRIIKRALNFAYASVYRLAARLGH